MSLFETATSTAAHLKMGIMGKQGAGKSFTAAKTAIGLVKHLRELGVAYAGKPVAFFDTETGSNWLIPLFEKEGVPFVVARKRTFAEVSHRAYVMKDRSTLLDGKIIDEPDFKDFLPHIAQLNLGGNHVGVQIDRDSTHILKTEKRDWQPVQRKIVLGEIQDLMVLHVPGQAAVDKQRRVSLLKKHFSAGWVEIEEAMNLLDLRAGYDSLHCEQEGKPSRYANVIEQEYPNQPSLEDIPTSVRALPTV